MKQKHIAISIVAVIAIAVLIFAYVKGSKEREADAEEDQPISAKSTLEQTNGVTIIHLDLKAQQLAGLEIVPVSTATVPPEIKAYGRVLDSASLVSLQSETVAARAVLQASQAEYDRLKRLSVQDNASAHALETAKAQLVQDQGALETAETQLAAASSKDVAAQSPEFFQSFASQKNILVRLDLPPGKISTETPTAAFFTQPGDESPIAAKFLGRAAAVDPQTQGEGFIFLVTNAPASLLPGLALTGFLQLPGEPSHGVIVPNDAVVRSDDRAWIYAQTGKIDFERREIILDHPADGGWFVTNGIAAGEEIVVTGAQALLSEERKSQIKLED
ncbi:MAG TPA: hypothetical protein VFC85_09225 [Verrucomicrobiae bacterium]|nr:hypothetical protein [Verrucomicrobiae bacterium]